MSYDPNNCPHGIRWHLSCKACLAVSHKSAQLAERKRLARVLLDDHRAGIADYSQRRVSAALLLTGDLAGRLS